MASVPVPRPSVAAGCWRIAAPRAASASPPEARAGEGIVVPARPPRLKLRRDFLRVASRGQRASRPGVTVQALALPEAETRIGFTATKKLGNAVIRNRAKRRLREAARLLLAERTTGHEIVLLGREGTLTRPFATLLGDMRGALKQAGVL